MVKHVAGKAKPKTSLWWVGLWATIWWGVSGIFVVILFWQARHFYIFNPSIYQSSGFFSAWARAVIHTYRNSRSLEGFSLFIFCVWVIGAIIWLKELKANKIAYSAAFKDLFLTIRK